MAQTKDINYRELRDAYVELMARTIRPNGFLTLVTNGEGSTIGMRKGLKSLLARIDWALLGPKWQKQPKDERTEGVFILEHVEGKIHAHGMLRLPPHDENNIHMIIGTHWTTLCPGGNSLLLPIGDAERRAGYCTKEMSLPWFSGDQVICTWDFMNR
ncbi:hypothetical protein [Shinella sp.]|uniref:hypothetical protein n=1 Tax=Shinella sp. TaxID=1870904 RepID=UPI0039E25343